MNSLRGKINLLLDITMFTFNNRVGVGDDVVSKDDIYHYLIESAKLKHHTTLEISPLFLGERHQSDVRGHVTNIGSNNSSVGDVSSALMRGVVRNLKKMMNLKEFKVIIISIKLFNLLVIYRSIELLDVELYWIKILY